MKAWTLAVSPVSWTSSTVMHERTCTHAGRRLALQPSELSRHVNIKTNIKTNSHDARELKMHYVINDCKRDRSPSMTITVKERGHVRHWMLLMFYWLTDGCVDKDPQCGANPGWSVDMCTSKEIFGGALIPTVNEKCPQMCGKCSKCKLAFSNSILFNHGNDSLWKPPR